MRDIDNSAFEEGMNPTVFGQNSTLSNNNGSDSNQGTLSETSSI